MCGRVLETGEIDQVNLTCVFRGSGVEYVNVCPEGNPRGITGSW